MRPWIKVCGITRAEDARMAVAAGAHAVGLILVADSPRRVAPERAADIAASLPSHVARVGVVADESAGTVRRLVAEIGLTAIQAHGEESADRCRSYGVPVVKAFPTGGGFALEHLEPFRAFSVLLDGFAPGRRGGTGERADWRMAARARAAGYRVLLAGGLGPDNVEEAVRSVGPVAVDLNSGVESAPGIKDGERLRAAVETLQRLPESEEAPWPW